MGGELDSRFSSPLPVRGRVEKLFRPEFVIARGHLAGTSYAFDRCAVLALDGCNVVLILVPCGNGALFAVELFEAAGFDPFGASLVVAKSPAGFRATYDDEAHPRRAGLVLSSEQPGCAPPRYWTDGYLSTFSKLRRPTWPWDLDMAAPEMGATVVER